MRGALKCLLVAAAVTLLPSLAFAQGTLTGTVKDASGGVLPGVTVEATAPNQAVRTVVTDDNGIYRIIDLAPGVYSLTFSLPGFGTVTRPGMTIAGTQVL